MASNQRVIVQVDISVMLARQPTGGNDIRSLLDMLRYAGLLESNTPSFPDFIQYTSTNLATANGEVRRWASFGIRAVIL